MEAARVPDLPGYYYDSTKNRYFKITASHLAQASSSASISKYTHQAVLAEQAQQESEQREALLKASRDAVTVKRSTLLQHPLLDFESRLGSRMKSPGWVVKGFQAASLSGRPAVPPDPFINQPDLRPCCNKFSVDKETGLLTMVAKPWDFSPDSIGLLQLASEGSEHIYGHGYTAPSLTHTTNVDHIASLGRRGVNVWAGRASSPYNNNVSSGSYLTVTCHTLPERGCRPNELVETAPRVEFRVNGAVFDLATSPTYDAFAVAEEKGVVIRWPDLATSGASSLVLKRKQGDTQPTSVWFKDKNILLFGARDGSVRLADLRSARKLEHSALRMQHDSAVSHIRTIGPYQVLAHGLETTSLYDLRWCPPPRSSTSRPHQSSETRNPVSYSNQAYLTFNIPQGRRQNRYGLGFAYDPELNMVLGATHDYLGYHVNLWDASTGQLLQSPLCDHTFQQPVTCADVVDLRPQAKSFLLACDGDLQEWSPLAYPINYEI